jgi:hypothetical protein
MSTWNGGPEIVDAESRLDMTDPVHLQAILDIYLIWEVSQEPMTLSKQRHDL